MAEEKQKPTKEEIEQIVSGINPVQPSLVSQKKDTSKPSKEEIAAIVG